MTDEKQLPTQVSESALSKLILKGDISSLSDTEKVQYYHSICGRLGIDPLTKPFSYLVLSGKQCLYLNKGGAEQLSKVNNVSHSILETKVIFEHIYQVIVRAEENNRHEDATGSVNVKGLSEEPLSNALMKAETKAKRRSTLALLGLGMLDETEVETIPNAIRRSPEVEVVGESTMIPGATLPETVTEPSMEDWEQVHKLVKDNGYPLAYYNVWKDREAKHKKPVEVYEAALIKFGQPNKSGIAKDEVTA